MFSVITTASALAMDAFSVSIGAGACRCAMPRREVLSLSLAFGLFQFVMPIGGWFFGSRIASIVATWDHWIAALLLGFVGAKMICDSLHPDEDCMSLDISRPAVLLGLAVATSIDAMAVGFSMAALGNPVFPLAVLSGLITAALSALGAMAGCRIGEAAGHRAEFIGGVVLLLIGFNILRIHLNWF